MKTPLDPYSGDFEDFEKWICKTLMNAYMATVQFTAAEPVINRFANLAADDYEKFYKNIRGNRSPNFVMTWGDVSSMAEAAICRAAEIIAPITAPMNANA